VKTQPNRQKSNQQKSNWRKMHPPRKEGDCEEKAAVIDLGHYLKPKIT